MRNFQKNHAKISDKKCNATVESELTKVQQCLQNPRGNRLPHVCKNKRKLPAVVAHAFSVHPTLGWKPRVALLFFGVVTVSFVFVLCQGIALGKAPGAFLDAATLTRRWAVGRRTGTLLIVTPTAVEKNVNTYYTSVDDVAAPCAAVSCCEGSVSEYPCELCASKPFSTQKALDIHKL